MLAADGEVEVLRELDLARMAIAHLPGAAGVERVVDADGRHASTADVVDSVESISEKRNSLNTFLPITLVERTRNVSVLLSVAIGALGQIEIADAEVAAIVLAARVLRAAAGWLPPIRCSTRALKFIALPSAPSPGR